MNKSISYEKKIVKKIKSITAKYKCDYQLVDNLNANGCILNFENKFIIFISNKLDHKLLPLTILHELGHIHFNTFRSNPKKYNYFIELLSNLYAANRLLFTFNIFKGIKLIILSFISEKKLYSYYINNTIMEGNEIYEQILKN